MLHLVLGGARSGKTRYALKCVQQEPPPWYYLATAQPLDAEMQHRIALHQQERGEQWRHLEVPFHLAATLQENLLGPLVVDCMTMWLTNMMLQGYDVAAEKRHVLHALERAGKRQHVVVVSNEVGLGIVPENALARRFRDEAGLLNQELAQIADHVVLIAAGLPLVLK
ncbi:bifunctional adenosylcobinamide kinase/adenosylcobinamide-phosphate guanylyltransferase [Entomobacter blattae]|uniref:Bifunctional adenosylcobalamin biosynthesis protein n=1 Tax=Entomobacter blattae TaxID=2762277 RepID=A0A7H1NQ31_9PROT|nr:bifunctional adenosylcobinamide kinase/adenosylcobinamide-phosphate guanylyltransferase [Entomobacter blattae]QNT77891.1 Bifunctional adenosylcobalamin biosynthesis protein CobP [Entomobacter blattae]